MKNATIDQPEEAAHTHDRRCPVCNNGFCKHVRVNYFTRIDQIIAEIERSFEEGESK